MFLAGSDATIPRPFGDVILDGIDLDIEGGAATGYAAFANQLRQFYALDNSKTYYIAGKIIIQYKLLLNVCILMLMWDLNLIGLVHHIF